MNIESEARKYFRKHYPKASIAEIDKQVEDWKNKINSGKKLVDFFTERVGGVRGKKILDVGFGSGGICIAFSFSGADVSGLDVDSELKEIAERNADYNKVNIDFRIYDGSEFPFKDDYFDYIVSFSVLEHITFPEKVLKEMFRVLKSQGKILLTLPNKYAIKETHTLAYFVSYMPRKIANKYLELLHRSPLDDDNLHFYSYFDVIKILNKTGYKYKLLYKDMNDIKGIKRLIAIILKKFNIHYTVFLRQLMFIIEKQ